MVHWNVDFNVGKVLVAESDPVVKLKESQLRGSLDQGRELGVVMGKAQAEGWGLGLLMGSLRRQDTE